MKLDRVTITGADDSVRNPKDLIELSARFPFVEWGILLSATAAGRPRFPSQGWLDDFLIACANAKTWPKLSAHVCGSWVREFVKGTRLPGQLRTWLRLGRFDRVQLNFHASTHVPEGDFFSNLVADATPGGWIFQVDGMNDAILEASIAFAGEKVRPLFDLSGGAGVLPKSWPKHPGFYCGYAGGLSVENLADQLNAIDRVARGDAPVWIDVETHVRTPDDLALDLAKVDAFLRIARPRVYA